MRWSLCLLVCGLATAAGCLGNAGPPPRPRVAEVIPLPTPSPVVRPAATAAAGALADPDWAATPIGAAPAAFVDPAAGPGPQPYWLASGRWDVVSVTSPAYSGLALQAHDEQPQPWLSFRILDQAIPDRYRVTATVQPVSSPRFKAPVGEISLIPYYRDPTHYLEMLVTNERLEIWLADGAAPDTDRGWTGIHFLPLTTGIGDLRTVTIEADLSTHDLTVAAGDQTYRVRHPFLDPGQPHRVAVRAAGNTFNLIRLRVDPRS